MNILKSRSHRLASVVNVNCNGSYVEDLILRLTAISDVYLIIDPRESDINMLRYANIMRATGYIKYNSSIGTTANIINVIRYIVKVVEGYRMITVPMDYSNNTKYINNLGKYYMSSIDSSIFKSRFLSHDEMVDIYTNKSPIYELIGSNSINGMYSSSFTGSNVVLTIEDVGAILSYIHSDNKYLRSFSKMDFGYFIASIFDKLNLKFINEDINEFKFN